MRLLCKLDPEEFMTAVLCPVEVSVEHRHAKDTVETRNEDRNVSACEIKLMDQPNIIIY